ncbi:hypothetical protein MJN51_34610, partial [Salmonella enterica subsp. enterica serovar Kentucky]|nr:hypothetical protein [Salmonella enterica subsp. enterica serovar Kentucky]
AYDYAAIGCIETAVGGKWGYRCTGMSFINFARVMLAALEGGRQARKRDKFGLAICNHCSNEIKEKRWSPALRQLFTEQKPLFNL